MYLCFLSGLLLSVQAVLSIPSPSSVLLVLSPGERGAATPIAKDSPSALPPSSSILRGQR